MSTLLASIARALTTHWKRGLLGIVATIVLVGAIAGSQGGAASEDFTIPGTESQRATDLLKDRFPAAAGAESQIVFSTKTGKLDTPQNRQSIAAALKKVEGLDHVTSASNPFTGGTVSKDGRIGFSTVQYDVQQVDLEKEDGEKLEDAARTAEGSGREVQLRGEVVDLASEQDAPVGELVGIAIAMILLTMLFRSAAAMGVTLLGALVGVMISQIILAAVAKPIGIPDFASQLAIMLGLGAGIDYSLLIFSRFREQLAAGDDAPTAAARANATSGVAVVAAGVIVMVAIAGLLAVGVPLMGKMGVGAAIAIAMVVLSSVLVLPVFAGMLAKRLHPKDPKHVARSEGFARWGEKLVKRPVAAVVAGGLVLVLLAIPTFDMRLGQPDDANQPKDRTQRQAYDQLAAGFGEGFSGPLLLAVGNPDGDKLQQSQLTAMGDEFKKVPGVANVAPAQMNESGDAAIIRVTPTTSPQDDKTSDLVERLRDDVVPAATAQNGLDVFVGGQTAGFEDFSSKISSRLPIFIAIVCGLSILLLMAVFRSVWVPLASAVFNLLSIGAAYGVLVAVFQWGVGASLIGVEEGVPIISFVPLMMFAILFGLSMDYNVFLISRIREAYFEGDSPADSVVHGLSRIAKVVLTAGLIMAAVFLAFMPGGDVTLKMFGLGLGVAILIDVLVVRMVVSPALMALLGDKAWWMPAWLDKALPDISLEGSQDQQPQPQPS